MNVAQNDGGDFDEAIREALERTDKPHQQEWLRSRLKIMRGAGLRSTPGRSRYAYFRNYDPEGPNPQRVVVLAHPERDSFVLDAHIADEYDTDDVYTVADPNRVLYRGRDPKLFGELMHRAIDFTRTHPSTI